MRGVDPLISERNSSLAQPHPGVLEVSGEGLRERRFGRGPAVVLLPFRDPLLAVVALSSCHGSIVMMERVSGGPRKPGFSLSGDVPFRSAQLRSRCPILRVPSAKGERQTD